MTDDTRFPLGGFLDSLPKDLYIAAHVAFLGIGIWLWARAHGSGLPYAEALLLYAASQIVCFGYFANWITLKMAVLAEQSLMVAMVLLIVLQVA
jgi:hypothetical protein